MKKSTLLLLIFFGLNAKAQIPTNGLIACYPFNNTTNDYSGYNNNGTIVGGVTPTTDRFGNPNSAYAFNGSSYISVPNSASLSSPDTAFSVAYWIRLDANNLTQPVICKTNTSTSHFQYRSGIWSFLPTPSAYFCYRNVPGNTVCYSSAVLPLSLTVWYHVVATYDNSFTRFYLNGVLVDSAAATGNILPDNLAMDIGRDAPGASEYLTGALDDLKVYNVKLTNSEVSHLYNNNVGACSNATADTCKTTQISLNTGADENGNIIPFGQQDPNWQITSIQNTIPMAGYSVPYNPFVIPQHGAWFVPTNSRWLNRIDSYNDADGPLDTHVEYTRHFTTLQNDNFKIKLNFSADNFIDYFRIDGVNYFSAPMNSTGIPCWHCQLHTALNDTIISLPAGCHDITVSYGDYYGGNVGSNPAGLLLEGYIQSVTGDSSILKQTCVTNTSPTLTANNTLNYCSNCEPVSPNLTITSGLGCGNLDTAKVYFTSGYTQGQDTLIFVPQLGINFTFNASTGVLTLYGNANYGVWETVLRTVCYSSLVLNANQSNTTKNVVISLGSALYNPVNNHFYKLVNNGSALTWHVARNAAANSTYFGQQGYLVTITTAQENNFLTQELTSVAWIGASDSAQEGIWRWVTGCEGLEDGGQGRHFSDQLGSCGSVSNTGASFNSNFVNWQNTEPNDYACNEDYAHININPMGQWNDYPDDLTVNVPAYIIEYGCSSISITGNITINILSHVDTTINHTICAGDSIFGYNTTGTWIDTFTSVSGCDSLRILHLAVNECCADTTYVLNQIATGPDLNNCFVLTPNTVSVTGNITFKNLFNLNQAFDKTYQLNFGCLDGNGADGMSIVLQNQSINYVGVASDNVGTNTNPHQLKIEFDTWENNSSSSSVLGDPWYDHIAILKNGAKNHTTTDNIAGPVQASLLSGNIEDCIYHDVRILWLPTSDSLFIFFDNNLRLTLNMNLVDSIFNGNPFVYLTIVGATGGYGNDQRVCIQNLFQNNNTTINQTICQGDSVLGYTTTGTWIDTFTSVSGCDSLRILNLTVNPTTSSIINHSICQGQSYFGHNISGTWIDHFTSANSCDSIRTLNLIVNPLPIITASASQTIICQGSSTTITATGATNYAWMPGSVSGTSITVAPLSTTTYTVTGTNTVTGCSNTSTKTITVNNNSSSSISATACNSYTWNSVTYITSGTYTFTSLNASGCGHTATLNLTINYSTASTGSVTACDTYAWNSNTYTVSGIYTHTSLNASGCVHTATLNLTINYSTTSSSTITACDSYVWNSITYTTSGTYTYTSLNTSGCVNTAILTLLINYSSSLSSSATACNSYMWNSNTYTTSGTYTFTSLNASGCVHTATLNLTVNYSTTSASSVTACDLYTWNSSTYTTSGTYTHTSLNASGCVHTATLNLTINYSTTSSSTTTACDSYVWNSITYTTSGTYTYTSLNTSGCVNTAILTLLINYSSSLSSSATACNSYMWNSNTYTTSGTYTFTSLNASGCVHTATLNLTINYSTASTGSVTACDTYAWNSNTYTVSGIYTHTSLNAFGCLHTATLNLIINYSTTSSSSMTACNSYSWNGTTYTNSGTYTYTTLNTSGCVNTATLTLSINPFPTLSIMPAAAEICKGNTITLSASGAILFSWSPATGLNTTAGNLVNANPSSTITYTIVGTDLNGCMNSFSKTVTVYDTYTKKDTIDLCEGMSYNFAGQVITTSGIYTNTFTSIHGCDSILQLKVNVIEKPIANFIVPPNICANTPIDINNTWVSNTVNYTWSFSGNPTILSQQDAFNTVSWNTTGTKTVSVVITPMLPCLPVSFTTTTTVNAPYVNIKVQDNDSIFCIYDNVNLTTYNNPTYKFEWAPAPYFVSNIYKVSGQLREPIYASVKVTDTFGCTKIDTMFLNAEPCCSAFLPNAFSPNGDDVNDEFGIIGEGNYHILDFFIANRWGNIIFKTIDPKQKWDGKYKGVEQNMDMYFYYLKYECSNLEKRVLKGEIILIR